ncbi:hypothetical protein [Neobacillus bataviensis]|uniref:hypothetical protein n=1 Tax=Neobacillus bataviensis TaxID=220685 RepID=UPI0011A6EC3E|nr:hypothetical protein [Neobacillus bataviensis]
MKTWEMIKQTVQGDVWFSETLGYSVIHASNGFVSLKAKSKGSIKVSNNFLRATDWRKVNKDTNNN